MCAAPGSNGVEELRDAALAVGLEVKDPAADSGADLILVNAAGGQILVQIKQVSLAAADGLERRLGNWESGEVGVPVLVADRITEQAREILRAAGWGWLDLRGHLHLAGKGLFVDANVPRLGRVSGQSPPLTGRVSEEVTALMLLRPAEPPVVREIARTLARSASTVSKAVADLRAAGLVDGRGRPVVPDLFWQLADRWRPARVDVARTPVVGTAGPVNDALRLGRDDVAATTGWALTDSVAAAAYGAPIGIRADHPPDFYVPDQTILRRAAQLLGAAQSHESRAATIRVAPFPLVCARRVELPGATWPLARPLFVALDLASDPGRGREVLADWTPPPEAGPRVW
ncbi:MarR family protein [Asanoa hainanensis]|uniref:MarR family protein n=1 Tax=Asanoa hainanensis TaxID=560556 RepID=A0A239P2B7_9ACTN|nr:MarR family transcriptional regulator [Asanoa hainanensis]SNT61267.1 MarR family protein [Asanoa hainanensis]